MTTETQAPEGGQMALNTVVRVLDDLLRQGRSSTEGAELSAAISTLRAALAAPAPQAAPQRYSPDGEGGMEIDSLGDWVKFRLSSQAAPVALTAAQIERGREAWGGERFNFTAGVRFAECAHGIPAPQTKEPTNDR